MCGSRIIIPTVARKRTLDNIHEGHQGEVKCRLKTGVYWPGMYNEITEMVQKCASCQEYANAQPKCTMIPMDVPPHPWHTLGADHFKYKGRWYLIVSDYFSKMPFIRPVSGTSAHVTIAAVKGIISENGIPHKVVSDNNPFNSYEFKQFAKIYGFEVVPSSPEYPRGHGLIERHVQTVKKCMYKCDHSGQDVELALLSLRSTPLDSHLPSPAELLNNRKYRTTMPTVNQDASPVDNGNIRTQLENRQQTSKKYYDRHSKDKTELSNNQPVRVRNQETKRWEPAHVIKKAGTPRSYVVQRHAGGVPLRRNRQHIRPTREQWDGHGSDELEDVYFGNDDQAEGTWEMVGSEPSLRTTTSSASTREMVDSEPSPRAATSASGRSPQQQTNNNAASSTDDTSSVGPRYPHRQRASPDFYQAGK